MKKPDKKSYGGLIHAEIADEELVQLVNKLKSFGPKLAKRGLKGAVNVSSTIVLKEAIRRCPYGDGLDPDGNKRKHLRDMIAKRVRQYARTSVALVGTYFKKAPHDHLVHDGTKKHEIFLPWEKAFRLGDKIIRGPVIIEHPGTSPQRFIQDAFTAKRAEVMRKMKDKIAKFINKTAGEKT